MGLTASDAEIRDYLREAGLVGPDGRLDRERITQYAESEFGSVPRFQERLRADLLAEKMASLIRDSAAVSDAETRDAVRYQLEEVKIAAVKLDGRQMPPGLEVPAEAAEASDQQDPERVRTSYEARKSEFDRPEQAHIRHILARFEAGDDAAKQSARGAHRCDPGAHRRPARTSPPWRSRSSEDPVTKERGGDLGFVSRGSS